MMIGVVGFIVLFFLILVLRIPIGFSMLIVGFAGTAFLTSLDVAIAFLGRQVLSTAASFDMAMVAMFILMGELAFNTGIGEKSFEVILKWVGRVRGSLAMASIGASAAFAAVCGSSPATAATIGSMALPEMKKYGYQDSLATGCIAAGGTLGILIPPSLGFILFGLLTEQSIAKLYLAGLIPGLLLSALFMATCYLVARLGPPSAAPPVVSVGEKLKSLTGLIEIVVLFAVVIGGLGLGLFTPTAAGAVGVFGVLVISLAKRTLTWQKFVKGVARATVTSAMVITIFIGAMIFNYFLAASTLTFQLGGVVAGLPVPPILTVAAILVLWLVLGCVMDATGMIVLTVPVLYPIIIKLGYDPIWFGVLGVLMIECGLITPPVGMNCYIIGGIAEDVPLSAIFRGVAPFLIAVFMCVGLIMIFPRIALFLPSAM
jgi:tripartite ATP-independent transporter DctM subunit